MKETVIGLIILIMMAPALLALESGQFRLLSATDVNKVILISQNPEKKVKYLLDASTAKITVDGKAAEFKQLNFYSVVNVKFELKKLSKDGISLDGVASEIRILTPEQPKKATDKFPN